MFTPTLRCECAQPASDQLMRKWCIRIRRKSLVCFFIFLVACTHSTSFFRLERTKIASWSKIFVGASISMIHVCYFSRR